MKIPFDIKFRPQIESGEYKVEIGRDDPWPARIVCWDFDGNNLIVAVRNPNDREEGLIYSIDGKHKAVCPKIDSDLFIITPDPVPDEFGEDLRDFAKECIHFREELDEKFFDTWRERLLELARKEIEEELKEKVLHDYWKQAADQCAQARKEAKAEALKGLPRWMKVNEGDLLDKYSRYLLCTNEGYYFCWGTNITRDGYMLLVDNLEKLPKEEQK